MGACGGGGCGCSGCGCACGIGLYYHYTPPVLGDPVDPPPRPIRPAHKHKSHTPTRAPTKPNPTAPARRVLPPENEGRFPLGLRPPAEPDEASRYPLGVGLK